MRKSLLPLALVGAMFSAKAQVAHVDQGAVFFVADKSLVYNGGGVQTKGTGSIDIHGNVMVVGSSTDKLRTLTNTNTDIDISNAGANIVLRLNDPDKYATSTYGQLYVTGLTQANMPAIVRKEYKATKHGAGQQLALPFYQKSLASLASNIGYSGFSNQRGNPSVFYWDNNSMPQFHHLKAAQTTSDKNTDKDTNAILHNGAARYYVITGDWDPSAAIKNFDGKIYSDATPISYTLRNAGYSSSGVPTAYGVGRGRNLNDHGELLYTYFHDVWDASSQGFFNATAGSESGTYGRNIYQLGNPFMTNIDLFTIGYNERTAGGDDGNTITSIQGIRYEATGVAFGRTDAGVDTFNGTTTYKYINYHSSTGVPIGDTNDAIIKPMQAFVIKLRNNDSNQTLNFNTLRRFAYEFRRLDGNDQALNPYGVAAARNANDVNRSSRSENTVKQLRVIGFDENGMEVARTYYVVAKDAKTGAYNGQEMQVIAFNGALSTREELPTGGEDTSVANSYWLYINEANENDFLGKKIQMVADVSKIKKYRFEIAENARTFNDGQTDFVDGGKSFYIEQAPGQVVRLSHNMVVDATSMYAGLYYGTPATEAQLATQNVKADATSELHVAFEKDTRTHQVVFPKGWKRADVTVFDMSGRKVVTEKDVDATKNFVLPITVQGSYIVEVVSSTGVKAIKKIVK